MSRSHKVATEYKNKWYTARSSLRHATTTIPDNYRRISRTRSNSL